MRYSGTAFRLAQSSLAAPFSFKRTLVISTGIAGKWRDSKPLTDKKAVRRSGSEMPRQHS
jgi:hypothetical protein